MQILLALVFGATVGLALHFALPHRATRGAALAPMIGAAAGGIVWTALTWAGLALDNPWLWVASLVVPVLVTLPAVLLLSGARARRDGAERARLHIV